MLSANGRHVIVYNGEIYNFLELRAELEALGATFRTQSDTEVILWAWRMWQEGMLSRFNGMWALAIFDTETRELFLARDRFGIKPLLYAMSAERLVFASEQRAVVRSGLIAPSVDIDVARRLMLDPFGVEGGERTLCREVRRLQAGHFMRLREGQLEIRRWWCTLDHLPSVPNTETERVERFGELFRNAVALRMRSDVPIGTCLSGGFDSSAVICEMSAHAKAGMGPRDSTAWRHAFVAAFPGHRTTSGRWRRKQPRGLKSNLHSSKSAGMTRSRTSSASSTIMMMCIFRCRAPRGSFTANLGAAMSWFRSMATAPMS